MDILLDTKAETVHEKGYSQWSDSKKEMDDATMTKLPDVLSSRLGTVTHQKRNCPTLQKALIVDLKVWCQVCSDRHSLEVV